MIPSNAEFSVTGSTNMPSLTYKLDTENGRIVGRIDGRLVIEQTILKIIDTQRYAHLIYSWFFGTETNILIGQDFDFVQTKLEDLVLDAITQDDRISGIENFTCVQSENDSEAAVITFEAITTEGTIPINTEVKLNEWF